MDPSEVWGQDGGLRGGKKAHNKGEMATGYLQKGALPKLSLYCLLSRRRTSQGQGSLQMMMNDESTIKHKRKLIMISSKEEDHLHWQLGHVFCLNLRTKRYVEQALDLRGSQTGSRP